MKLIPVFFGLLAMFITASSSKHAGESIKGSWQVVRAQYGDEPMSEIKELTIIKTFTNTRWSGAWYNLTAKAFDGACGGTYTLKGDEYLETIEYYSWDANAIGQVAKFKLTVENGMLHQKGTISYKGNPNYIIEEWFKRID